MCNPLQSRQPAPAANGRVLLCYITDRRQFAGNPEEQEQRLLTKIYECAIAGVDYIQLREKDLSTRELERLATRTVAAIPSSSTTRLLINSRIDVALACGAHGVHLPARYLSAADARAIFSRAGRTHAVIGVSTHLASEVSSADSQGADFAVFGPVFEKSGLANHGGLEQLAALFRAPQPVAYAMPVLALGGVNFENASQCIAAGAAGVAAIRMFQENQASEIVKKLRQLRMAKDSSAAT